MRRPLVVLLLLGLLAGTAAAATIRGTRGSDRIMAAWSGSKSVSCGAGHDLVVADLATRVARDCETVVRRVSADPFTDIRSQHETAVEPASASFGSTVVAAFQLGRFSSGGAAGTGWARSTDAGRTWIRGVLPGLGRSSDPTVAFDSVHRVWLISALAIQNVSETRLAVSVVVSRSADGLHWSTPVVVHAGPNDDKEWLACDGGATSPFRGRCYDVYTDDQTHQISAQSSNDGGLTWSAPVRVGPDLIGTQPLVRPDGSLTVVAVDANNGRGTLAAFRTVDGGATFGTAIRISDVAWKPAIGLRDFPLPSAVAQADGTLDAVWQDCRFRAGCSANDLVLSSSSDGVTWSAPARIPLAAPTSTADFFIPGLGADPLTPGRLALDYVFFVPGSCAAALCRLAAGFTSSVDGGRTWRATVRLDALPMALSWLATTPDGHMVGDYLAVSIAAGRAVPVFALAAAPVRGRFRQAIFATSLAF